MISIVTVLVQLAGVLLSFTAIVAVQVLAAYRTQLERALDKEEVQSRRKESLRNIRAGVLFLILSVLSGVMVMAQLTPERSSAGSWDLLGLFLVVYSLLAGVVGLFLTVEDL